MAELESSGIPPSLLPIYSVPRPCDLYICVGTTPAAAICEYSCTPRQGQYIKERIKLVVLNVLSCIELGGSDLLNSGNRV